METGRRTECLDGAVSFLLWPGAVRQTAEEVGRRFPYAMKPQEAYADETGSRILTLNLLTEKLEGEQTEGAITEIQKIIEKLYPESICHKARCMAMAEVEAGWFSFITGSLVGEQLHIFFLLPVGGRMLFGSWHTSAESTGEATEAFLETMKSIRISDAIQADMRGKHADRRIL